MTKAKSKSEFYKDTTIPNTLLDELMNQLPAMPTQEDLFGPEGVVKQLSAALIERCLQAELSTHAGLRRRISGQKKPVPITAMGPPSKRSRAMLEQSSSPSHEIGKAVMTQGTVKKHQTSLTGFNEKILWMYAA